MDKSRAALFCYSNQLFSRERIEQELQFQQKLLKNYADTHAFEVFGSYHCVGLDQMNLTDPVIFHMLQDAKRGDFDIILLERFEPFITCFFNDFPLIRLFFIAEKKQILLDNKNSILFKESPVPFSGGAVYIREDINTYQRSFGF